MDTPGAIPIAISFADRFDLKRLRNVSLRCFLLIKFLDIISFFIILKINENVNNEKT